MGKTAEEKRKRPTIKKIMAKTFLGRNPSGPVDTGPPPLDRGAVFFR
jgi:hypothetical protein